MMGTACRERGTFEVGLGVGLKIAGKETVLTRLTEQERHVNGQSFLGQTFRQGDILRRHARQLV